MRQTCKLTTLSLIIIMRKMRRMKFYKHAHTCDTCTVVCRVCLCVGECVSFSRLMSHFRDDSDKANVCEKCKNSRAHIHRHTCSAPLTGSVTGRTSANIHPYNVNWVESIKATTTTTPLPQLTC